MLNGIRNFFNHIFTPVPRKVVLEGKVNPSELTEVAPFAQHLLRTPTITELNQNVNRIREKLTPVQSDYYEFYQSNISDFPYFLELKKAYSEPKMPRNMQQFPKNPHPTNLTNELQNHFYTAQEVRELFERNPNLNKVVGSIPYQWKAKFASEKGLQKLDDVFYAFSKSIFDRNIVIAADARILETGLSGVFGQDVSVKLIGEGAVSRAFKFSIGKDDYVLKCYKSKSGEVKNVFNSIDEMEKNNHGNYAELCGALYAKKHSPSRFVKFYMGRFGENGDGYMITKFEPKSNHANSFDSLIQMCVSRSEFEEMPIPEFKFGNFLKRVNISDYQASNVRGNVIVDYGTTKPTLADNFTVTGMKLARQIISAVDTNNKKRLEQVLKSNKSQKDLDEVKAWMQKIINKEVNPRFAQKDLYPKREILAMLGIDWTPNLGYLLKEQKLGFWIPENRSPDTLNTLPVIKHLKYYPINIEKFNLTPIAATKIENEYANIYGAKQNWDSTMETYRYAFK